jgi:rRNA maturation RNase YbeY
MKYEIGAKIVAGKGISEQWIKKIVVRALEKMKISCADISIALVGNREIKKWNNCYRGKNKVTDVLSFIYGRKPLAGEILICYPMAARQAGEHGWSAKDEIKLLLVHGLLHLAGYDHEKSLKEAKRMEVLQCKLLNDFK